MGVAVVAWLYGPADSKKAIPDISKPQLLRWRTDGRSAGNRRVVAWPPVATPLHGTCKTGLSSKCLGIASTSISTLNGGDRPKAAVRAKEVRLPGGKSLFKLRRHLWLWIAWSGSPYAPGSQSIESDQHHCAHRAFHQQRNVESRCWQHFNAEDTMGWD
jgi:hypothetical protein